MALTSEFEELLYGGVEEPPTPPLSTQLTRGFVSGLTLGGIKPYAEAPPGGLPETLARFAGLAIPALPVFRVGGLAAAGLGRFFPSFLSPSLIEAAGPAAASRALARMLSFKPRAISEALALPGQTTAIGIGSGLLSAGEEVFSPEPRPLPERLINIGISAGLGALGVRAGEAIARGLGLVRPPARTAGMQAARQELDAVLPEVPEQFRAAIREIDDQITSLKMALRGQTDKRVRRRLERAIKELETAKERRILQAHEASPQAQSAAVVESSPQLELPLTSPPPVRESGPQLDLFKTPGVITAEGLQVARTPEEALAEAQRRMFLERRQRALEMIPKESSPLPGYNLYVQQERKRLAEDVVWTRGTLPPISGGSGAPDPANQQEIFKRVHGVVGIQPVEPARVTAAQVAIRTGLGHKLPSDASLMARTIDDVPFVDPWLRHLPGSPRAAESVGEVLGAGPSVRGLGRLGRFLGTPKWFLAGTPAERLPEIFAIAEGRALEIAERLWRAAAPVLAWSPETKEAVRRLFFENPRMHPNEFADLIAKKVPEASEGIAHLRDILERIRLQYVRDGVLREDQRFLSYFPVVREILEVRADGVKFVEGGQGYFPVPLQNLVPARDRVVFARRRGLMDPEDFPRSVGFDGILKLYFGQFGRHRAVREILPHVDEILNDLRPYEIDHPGLLQYVGDYINFWLGQSGLWDEGSRLFQGLRQFQFLRTIGFSVFSPLVNTLQRLNTFAVVRPSAFFKAFDDMKNPERLELMRRAGLPRETLAKVGIEEVPVEGDFISRFASRLQEAGGSLFSASERANRVHAFMAGLREGEARGLSGQELLDFARRVVFDTQFVHTRANLPPAFRGDIGRTLGQFQTFRINQTQFLVRLLDEARRGNFTPLIRYIIPTLALGGGTITMGDWMQERVTKEVLGEATKIPGFLEVLGVSLNNQLGLGAINLEDLGSFLFFLPGPSVTYLQGLVGIVFGSYYLGRGVDPSQAGRELSFDERVRLVQQSLPGGLQLSRVINALRLLQNDGEYRRAMDWKEALGMSPASGELISRNTASAIEVLTAAAGIPSAARVGEIKKLQLQRDLEREMMSTIREAADLIASGRLDDAMKVVDRFNRKYRDEGAFIPGISPQSLRAAVRRRMLPPGERVRPPVGLMFHEAFQRQGEEM